MALVESWHFKSRARECAVTGQPFHDGEPICTALFTAADGGFERRDFSLAGWDQRDPASPAPFSFWRSTFQPAAAEDRPEVVAKESAEDLLRRLVEDDHEATENVRYILAVMLERRKLLRETDHQRTPHGILRIYEHRKTGEVLIIRDPDVPLDQVEHIQQEVMAMLAPREPTPGLTESAGPAPDATWNP
jgi:hypothetical protein